MKAMRTTFRLVPVLMIVALMAVPQAVLAKSEKRTGKAKGEFGILIGSIPSMDIELTRKGSNISSSFETDGDLSGGLFFEQRTYAGLWAGLSLDVHRISKDFYNDKSENEMGLGLALRLSTRFVDQRGRWILKPGIASGVAMFPEVYNVQSSQYWTLIPFVEVVHMATPKLGILGQVSMLNTLMGGNSDYDISVGPGVLVRLGLVFK